MTAIKIENFGGLIPRASARLLPPTAATAARNAKLLSGELKGFRKPEQVADLTDRPFTVRRVFRVPDSDGDYYGDAYLAFDSLNVDVVRSPIVNDAYDRYYWAGDGPPKYNTAGRILAGLPPYLLGVPRPSQAMAVLPPAGTDFTRAYVYTFVSEFGEEGQPSDPTLATGASGTWQLTGMQTTVPNSSERRITHKNIYRTVVGQEATLYFFVAKIPLAQSTYNDSSTDDVIALNNVLESQSYAEPPADLEGFTLMPNGYLIGWAGRRLCFSEPYRPHAWPPEYELATDFEIRGLVVYGATVVIGTASRPYLGQGVSPAAFTMTKMDAVEPCLSRRGMVATVVGAYYPSINGLVLANTEGVRVITQDILTKEEWARYNPENLFAAQLGLQYIAFNSSNFGLVFNPTEPSTKLVELDQFANVSGIETDYYTGNVQIIDQNRLWDWDPEGTERLFWRWKSKEFHFPRPLNFGAARLSFDTAENDVEAFVLSYYQAYNNERFNAGPLGTIGGHAINHESQDPGQVPGWTEPEIAMPIGGDSLYPIEFMKFQRPAVRLIVRADGRVRYDKVIYDQEMIRLPTGFKATVWQFELIGNTTVYSLQVAETGKELATV